MIKSINKFIYTVASMTMISRVLGFIRDVVMASLFGATALWDSFSIAFEIPNIIRQLFAEGSLSQAFIPVLVQYQNQSNEKQLKYFIASMIGTLTFILLIITLGGIFFSSWIVKLIAPGFLVGGVKFTWTVKVLQITFPFLILSSLTAFFSAILNTYNRFWVPAITPALLSIAMIIAALCFCSKAEVSIYVLAWAIVIAAVIQLGFQLWFLKPYRILGRPQVKFSNPGVKRVIKLMIPLLLGVSVWQINLFLDSYFASLLQSGSISWLYFSDRLIDVPIGIFGVAISTVILPQLARCNLVKSVHYFSEILDWAFRSALLVGLPSAIFIALLAGPLLSTLFQHGLLNGYAVAMSCKSLTVFAIGLTPLILIKILIVGFYSRQDMRTPVIVSLAAMILNFIFNIMFIHRFAHAGIAMATSLSALFNSIFLYYFLRRLNIYVPLPGWKLFFMKLFFANSIVALWLYFVTNNVQIWINHLWVWRAMHLALLMISSAIIYIFSLWIAGVRLKTLELTQQTINFVT